MNSGDTKSIILVGVGGQGILLGSEITAKAAVIAGYDVKTNEVHGMAQRGGSVVSQIRYGSKVYSPLVGTGEAAVLGSFEKIEALRFANYLSPNGLAVVSSQAIVPVTASSGTAVYPVDAEDRLQKAFSRLIYIDAAAIAMELGNIKAANVVVLGAISTGLDLPLDAWHQAVSESVPQKHRELNIKAFEAGRSAAK